MSDERETSIRQPAVAGRFYPADPIALEQTVRDYLTECEQTDYANPRGLIVPHAGYMCSAIVAAAAYRSLSSLSVAEYTVFLLGPAHWQPVNGVGLSGDDAFATPMGEIPVAKDIVRRLAEADEGFRIADESHTPEHSLEVELPFLQIVLDSFTIVPMLFGDGADPLRVAGALSPLLADNPHSLLVASSDLSHYHPSGEAQRMDREFLAAVEAGDSVAASRGQACGLTPILVLMDIAQRLGWQAHVADYRNSGDTCGPRSDVVGYGAVVYTE